MQTGLTYTATVEVSGDNTAANMGSGDLDVFATPSMIALMENAAMNAVAAELSDGSTTVGTLLNVIHSRATALGDQVSATALLEEIDGRKLIFHVSAFDSKGIIGEGIHERVIVDAGRFMDKVNRVG